MATVTQTVHSHFVRPSRTYDYLYDPTFVVSSDRDHARESFRAQTNIDRLRYVPHFKTMFSSLRHYPRQAITLDTTDPVPAHVSRQWKGYSQQARDTLIRYKKFNYDPAVQVPARHYGVAQVDGKNRYKYFRRPIIPFLPQMPPNVVLARTRVDPLAPPPPPQPEAPMAGPLMRSVHVQTDYRDSETQTEPYSPEYVVRPGSQPELLTLASLTFGHGLPAGLAEVEMVERARAKRAWEATLPSLSDPAQLGKRRRMMQEQEGREWAFREQEIDKLQQEKLALLGRMLGQREADHQALNERRLEHFWSKKQAEKDRRVRRLHSDHVKALRKLTEKFRNVEGKLERRNVIQEYTNFNSQVYAPMTRIGVYLDAGSEQYSVKNRYTTTLDGLLELEATLPSYVTQPRVQAPVRSMKGVGGRARQRARLGKVLDQVHYDIITEQNTGKKTPKPLRFLEHVEKPVPRPPTPTISAPSEQEERAELAVVLLQRVLRGRAMQSKMFEGKEQRHNLIAELRMTHALQAPEQRLQAREREAILSKQAHQHQHQHQAQVVRDAVESGAAGLLGRQLDLLSKELVRLQEERRVHAFAMLAERQQRMREAEESGQRQREERLRRTEDEMFKQVVRVHQSSVDSYLEDVILLSLEQTATEQARAEVRRQASIINTVAHQFQHTELSGRELVAELLYAFLLPEVEKQTMRDRVRHHQRRHLLAAHRILCKNTEDILEQDTATQEGGGAGDLKQGGGAGDLMQGEEGGGAGQEGTAGTPTAT